MNQLIEEQFKNQEQEFIPNQDHWLNFVGYIRTLNEVPTYTPRKISQQFVLVTNGGSSRTYIYDTVGLAWKYITLL